MPHYITPWKLGVHRIASIALFRALLFKSAKAPLDDASRQAFQNIVRNRFKQDHRQQSRQALAVAFSDGFRAIELLNAATNGDRKAESTLTALIGASSPRSKLPPPSSPYRKPLKSDSAATPVQNVPYSIMDRPRPVVKGTRRIPKLIYAANYPVLRIKKPQPASLSGYLRERVRTLLRWRETAAAFSDWHQPIAEYEDMWDAILLRDLGVLKEENVQARHDLKQGWRWSVFESRMYLSDKIKEDFRKRIERAQQYQRIVNEETRLMKRQRNRRRMSRRRRRRRVDMRQTGKIFRPRERSKTAKSMTGTKTSARSRSRQKQRPSEASIDVFRTKVDVQKKRGWPRKVQGAFGAS